MIELFPHSSEKLMHWRFNGEFGRNFSTAMDLQMWCFGCDIRRADGNLLLDYGFTRSRPTSNSTGSTHYIRRIGDDYSIHLWGFAVIATSHVKCLCLKRYERTPLLASVSTINSDTWRPNELPPLHTPESEFEIQEARQLLLCVARELQHYERFVQSKCGSLYRMACLKQRRWHKVLSQRPLSSVWDELVAKLDTRPQYGYIT